MLQQLPPKGATVTPERIIDIRQIDGSGTTVSIVEAIDCWKVSRATLQRRLNAGQIEGSHKRPGASGEQWRLPVVSLDNLWERADARPSSSSGSDGAPSPVQSGHGATEDLAQSEVLSALVDLITDLRGDLQDERKNRRLELEASTTDRDARAHQEAELVERTARAEAAVEAERERAADALARLSDLEVSRSQLQREFDRCKSMLTRRQQRRLFGNSLS